MSRRAMALLGGLLLSLSSLGGFTQPQDSDFQLLSRIDSTIFPAMTSFTEAVQLSTQLPEKPLEEATLRIFFKLILEAERAVRLVLVCVLAPEQSRGDLYLLRSDLLSGQEQFYFFKPGLKDPLPISGALKLFGAVGVGEAAGLSFAGRYQVAERQVDTLDGRVLLLLKLQAVVPTISYQKVSLWVQDDFRPQQAILHALSGTPLKRLLYEDFRTLDQQDLIASEIVVEDLLFSELTRFTIQDVQGHELPLEVFSPEFLPSVGEDCSIEGR